MLRLDTDQIFTVNYIKAYNQFCCLFDSGEWMHPGYTGRQCWRTWNKSPRSDLNPGCCHLYMQTVIRANPSAN